jgi:hypothetical protein
MLKPKIKIECCQLIITFQESNHIQSITLFFSSLSYGNLINSMECNDPIHPYHKQFHKTLNHKNILITTNMIQNVFNLYLYC